jgi:hypothetical protein
MALTARRYEIDDPPPRRRFPHPVRGRHQIDSPASETSEREEMRRLEAENAPRPQPEPAWKKALQRAFYHLKLREALQRLPEAESPQEQTPQQPLPIPAEAFQTYQPKDDSYLPVQERKDLIWGKLTPEQYAARQREAQAPDTFMADLVARSQQNPAGTPAALHTQQDSSGQASRLDRLRELIDEELSWRPTDENGRVRSILLLALRGLLQGGASGDLGHMLGSALGGAIAGGIRPDLGDYLMEGRLYPSLN